MDPEKMKRIGVGTFLRKDDVLWVDKRDFYKEQGLWELFNKRREFYKAQGQTPVDSNRMTQAEFDRRLLEEATGRPVLPDGPESGDDEYDGVDFFCDKADFGELMNAEIDPIRDLNWIYHNIAIKDVQPSDAPSTGAYAHLKFIQRSNVNLVDFFTKVYPRLIPSKSKIDEMNKFNDDGREHFSILERLLKEDDDDQGQISALQVGV